MRVAYKRNTCHSNFITLTSCIACFFLLLLRREFFMSEMECIEADVVLQLARTESMQALHTGTVTLFLMECAFHTEFDSPYG